MRRNVIFTHSVSSVQVSGTNVWDNSFSNEVARLSQGRYGSHITGINTLFFIPKSKVQ